MIIRYKRYSTVFFDYLQVVRESRVYFKKGKYSISWSQIINIVLFFLCFSSCGKSNAQGTPVENPQSQNIQKHVSSTHSENVKWVIFK
ncbi:MAG TPA: hypothetical protein VGF79_16055 [Bacteroidia bacterium]